MDVWRLRVELHGWIIQGHDVEALHWRICRTNRHRLGDLALDGEPGRELLQIGLFLVIDTEDTPGPLGKLRGPSVEVDVVTRLQPRSAGLRYHEVVTLCDPDMHRILPVRIACITLTQEGMTGKGPGHRLVHQRMQQPKHHRISDIRPQERRVGITMDLAVERLRYIRIGGQPLGDRTGPEVQPAAGGMGSAVQKRHRRHIELLRHHERHGLPCLKRHFNRLPRRIARRHDVDGVRHGIVHLHHQFTEAVVHPMSRPAQPCECPRPDRSGSSSRSSDHDRSIRLVQR